MTYHAHMDFEMADGRREVEVAHPKGLVEWSVRLIDKHQDKHHWFMRDPEVSQCGKA